MNKQTSSKTKSTPPSPEKQNKSNVQELKERLKECRKEKKDILNEKEIELKDREDMIEELKYRLKKQEEILSKYGEASPSSEEIEDISTKIEEEKKDLEEDKRRLMEKNEGLQKRIDRLKRKKRTLEDKLDEINEENTRLMGKKRSQQEGENAVFHLPSDAKINGDIESEEMIRVENQARILGSLKSINNVIVGHGNEIRGDVVSEEGDVKIGDDTEVNGVIKGKKVHLAEGVKADQIRAEENLIIDQNCHVSDIFALGDIELKEKVKVDGHLEYAGEFNAKGIEVTEAITPSSVDKVQEKSENILRERPTFIPEKLVKKEISKDKEIMDEESFSIIESVKGKVKQIREFMAIAEEKGMDITEEKKLLNESSSFYEEGKYEKGDESLNECYSSLKEMISSKLEKEDMEDIGIHTSGEEAPITSMIEKSSNDISYEQETEINQLEEEEKSIKDDKNPNEKEEDDEDEGKREEAIEDLRKIKGVGSIIAKKLYEAGFESVEELKKTSVEEIKSVDGISGSLTEQIKKNLPEE